MSEETPSPPAPPAGAVSENTLIWGLAVSQVIAIGCLFHCFTLFLRPMQDEFGWSITQMTGAFTVGLFVADVIAIPAGQWVDRHGGHLLMSLGASLAAVNLALWTQVSTLTGFFLLWISMGVAVGSTLGNIASTVIAANTKDYRRGLTYLSIVAGLSSTVVVPVVSILLNWYGWRAALCALALMQFLGPACLNAIVLRGTVGSRTAEFARRKASKSAGRPSGLASQNISPLRTAMRRPAFWLLAIAASVHWFVITGLNVHIMPLLQQRGVSVEMAVLIFSINGPAAVAGRIALHIIDRNGSARTQGRVFFPMFAVGMVMLGTVAYLGTVGLVAYAIVFGMAAGVLMIVRQTAIAEIFGLRGYGAIAGALSTVSILPRTCAPFAVALMAQASGSYEPVIWMLSGLIVLGTIAFYLASREAVVV